MTNNEEKNVIGIEAKCFKCDKVWNISLLTENDRGATCEECGGYVVTIDGKSKMRKVYEGEEIESPLLDPNASSRKEYKAADIPKVVDFGKFTKNQ